MNIPELPIQMVAVTESSKNSANPHQAAELSQMLTLEVRRINLRIKNRENLTKTLYLAGKQPGRSAQRPLCHLGSSSEEIKLLQQFLPICLRQEGGDRESFLTGRETERPAGRLWRGNSGAT